MPTDAYIDMRNLASPKGAAGSCPVANCAAPLVEADSQWRKICLTVQYTELGSIPKLSLITTGQRENCSAMRPCGISYSNETISTSTFLDNAAKAETNRICHENSEDALTWNVFCRLARGGFLSALLSTLTQSALTDEPELYTWGLNVRL